MDTNSNYVDLRHVLDPTRWNASEELKTRLRIPLERKAAEVIDLNEFVARRTRKAFSEVA